MFSFGQEASVETVVEGLTNPCGIAIQPDTGHLFVADSGALRVVRIVDGKVEPVIVGFPKDTYGAGPAYDIGPLGLAFRDRNTLIVGGGGNPDGEELLRLYTVPEAGADPIQATAMKGEPLSLPADSEKQIVGEGNFYGVGIFGDAVYTTGNGDDEKGWLGKATFVGDKLTDFQRAIPTKEKSGIDAPVAITRSPEGYIVVGQMGEITNQKDSLLTFYDDSGEKLVNWKFETGLNDISALAYGPKRGRLFAADFNWADATQGGLFKLVGKDKQCEAIKIVSLPKPSAMTFDAEGNLYVTVFGESEDGQPAGKLVVIKGLDSAPE